MQEKIIISGMGSLSALGSHADEIWNRYQSGEPRITTCCFNNCDTPVGKLHPEEEQLIKDLRKENQHYRRLDKSVLLSIFAARQAIEQSKWTGEDLISVNLGSSRGATQLFEKYHKHFLDNPEKRLSPLTSPTTTLGNLSSWVAYDLGLKGASFSHSITCSTALHAIANAVAWLQAGMAKKFVAGGAEAPLSDFTVAQMRALRIYSEEEGDFPSRPLDPTSNKNNMILGEGSAVFCLEKDAGQEALARIQGLGFSTELIEHNVSLSAEADCIFRSMEMALKNADINEVDCVVMHAPGTLKGDRSELKAIEKLFPENTPHLISTKFASGHSFGASGALSLELAILMLQKGELIDFPYPSLNKDSNTEPKTIMINATGFGGNAVSIILTK